MDKEERWDRDIEAKSRQIIPKLDGLNLIEGYIFERMFEAFADLRELAAYPSIRRTMPSLEETLDCAIKHSFIEHGTKPNRKLLIERFRDALLIAKVPEGRPNRYPFRRRLRDICCEVWEAVNDARANYPCQKGGANGSRILKLNGDKLILLVPECAIAEMVSVEASQTGSQSA